MLICLHKTCTDFVHSSMIGLFRTTLWAIPSTRKRIHLLKPKEAPKWLSAAFLWLPFCGWARSSSGLALAHLMLLQYSVFTPFCSFDKIGSEVFQADWDYSCLAGWWILVTTSRCCCDLDHTGGRTRASHSAWASASMWSWWLCVSSQKGKIASGWLMCS